MNIAEATSDGLPKAIVTVLWAPVVFCLMAFLSYLANRAHVTGERAAFEVIVFLYLPAICLCVAFAPFYFRRWLSIGLPLILVVWTGGVAVFAISICSRLSYQTLGEGFIAQVFLMAIWWPANFVIGAVLAIKKARKDLKSHQNLPSM